MRKPADPHRWHLCCYRETGLLISSPRRPSRCNPLDGLTPTPMDPPPSAVTREALEREAYLLWEAAGFPPGQSDHFWLMAEQQFNSGGPDGSVVPAPAPESPPASKSKRGAARPATPAPAPEAAPVHPTRRKPATPTAANSVPKAPAEPATPLTAPPKPAAKSPPKSASPPPSPPTDSSSKRPPSPR